jgi:hypothetical protein
MDDPWGSPWADEVQLPQTILTEEKKDVEHGPTTPARAATLKLQQTTNSPWDDTADDSFGDWATFPTNDGRSLGLDGQVDEWEDNDPAPGITSTKTPTNALLVDWNTPETQDERDTKPAPSPLLEVAHPVRLPSPDPWATSFILDKETTENIPDNNEQELQDVLEVKGEEPQERDSVADATPKPGEDMVLPDEEATDTKVLDIVDTAKDMESEDADAISSPVALETAVVADNSDGGPPSSRRSSSPSVHSQHDEMSQESPRTSFDEEPKRPQRPRAVSSKVQELVEHFDGLANQDISDVAASSTSSGQDTVKGAPELEDDDDFGDFEEGQSDEEQDPVEAEAGSSPVHIQNLTNNDHGDTQLTPKKFQGPVHFDVDTSLLNTLFPKLDADTIFENVFIPDVVPYDSFSTTEERKTWYRISRYGTLRKHNSGDDDYVRINWVQSQIRKETLNTVARWMEEDRISGRVVLGGVSKGSSIFGWNDKKAAPVPLAHAFAAKARKQKVEPVVEKAPEIPREWPQGLVRKPSTSKGSPSRTSRRSSVKVTESLPETKPIVEQPVAGFGWNSAPAKPQSLNNPSPPGHKSTESMSKLTTNQPKLALIPRRSLSVKKSRSTSPANVISTSIKLPTSASIVEPPSSKAPSTKPVTTLVIPDLVDDNDDWGDMVASPVVNSETAIPLPRAPLQPQSTSATQFVNMMNGVTTQPANHHQNPNLDEIFTPLSVGPSTYAFDEMRQGGVSNGPAIVPVSSATTAVDPWASADFSFFETAPAPVPPPKPDGRKAPQFPPKKVVSFSTSPLAPPRSERKSKEEMEQDRIVQDAVKSLPDLSYMLRR